MFPHVSSKLKLFLHFIIKNILQVLHNPVRQAVVERSNCTLKEILNKQEGVTEIPKDRLHSVLLTFNFFNANEQKPTAAERHWIIEKNF